jgi:hypothetical protein
MSVLRSRNVIALGAVLMAVLMFASLRGWSQAPPPGGPTVTLAIEVSLPDGAVFHIPAVGDGEVPGIVPLPQGRFAVFASHPACVRSRFRLTLLPWSGPTRSCRKQPAMTCGLGAVKTLVLTTGKRMHRCCSPGWVRSGFLS